MVSATRRPIFVTGELGNVGREVVSALLAKWVRVIAADHQIARVSAAFGDRVIAKNFDFHHRESWLPLSPAPSTCSCYVRPRLRM